MQTFVSENPHHTVKIQNCEKKPTDSRI